MPELEDVRNTEHRLTRIEGKVDQVLAAVTIVSKNQESLQEKHDRRITTLEHRHIALGAVAAFILVAAPFLFFYLDNVYEPAMQEVSRAERTPIP